jgi:hypothetical protein
MFSLFFHGYGENRGVIGERRDMHGGKEFDKHVQVLRPADS